MDKYEELFELENLIRKLRYIINDKVSIHNGIEYNEWERMRDVYFDEIKVKIKSFVHVKTLFKGEYELYEW